MHGGLQVPQGSTPRSLKVHLRGSLTRAARPGDAVTVTGVFLPEPVTGGYAARHAGLLTSTLLDASCIVQLKASYATVATDATLAARITVRLRLKAQKFQDDTTIGQAHGLEALD